LTVSLMVGIPAAVGLGAWIGWRISR
jgi:predicted MFS family arabinose efflux permease